MFPDCGNFDEHFMVRLSGKIEKLAVVENTELPFTIADRKLLYFAFN